MTWGPNNNNMVKETKLTILFTPCTKINLKWIKDLNERPEIIKLLEENTKSMLLDTNFFLNICSQAKETKAKINKWDYIKLKTFWTEKKTINKMKRSPTGWKKISANEYLIRS